MMQEKDKQKPKKNLRRDFLTNAVLAKKSLCGAPVAFGTWTLDLTGSERAS